jgi:hypothetical protein
VTIERPALTVTLCALVLFLHHQQMFNRWVRSAPAMAVAPGQHDALSEEKTELLIEAVEALIIELQDALDEEQIKASCRPSRQPSLRTSR